LTIIQDIGDFAVDDGKWLAFPCLPDAIPPECFGDNAAARLKFWTSSRGKIVGRGPTPTAAITDLVVRLDAGGCKLWRTRDDGGWPI
jgi:hypothetical protein